VSQRYVFHNEWRLPRAPDEIYAALRDVASYPRWWPQVRSVRRLSETSGELRCRSLLPYELAFVVSREIEDPHARVLSARQTGDLDGTSCWTVHDDGTAVFDEDVVVRKALVRVAGRLAGAALRFNHDLMMRAGERGLRRYLERG
jgi:polyketide cyclase/dehydrase/lipid transport protein